MQLPNLKARAPRTDRKTWRGRMAIPISKNCARWKTQSLERPNRPASPAPPPADLSRTPWRAPCQEETRGCRMRSSTAQAKPARAMGQRPLSSLSRKEKDEEYHVGASPSAVGRFQTIDCHIWRGGLRRRTGAGFSRREGGVAPRSPAAQTPGNSSDPKRSSDTPFAQQFVDEERA